MLLRIFGEIFEIRHCKCHTGALKTVKGVKLHTLQVSTEVFKFLIDTEGAKLMEPTMVTTLLWKLKGVVDTGFAMDVDTRRSITGYLIYFCEALIAWNSRLQKNVTLSSMEGKYVGLSEISTEILFVRDVLVFVGIQIQYPIIVHVDNKGAIFLANIDTLGQRTKNIQNHYHFTREYMQDGILKIVYISNENNDTKIFSKNTGEKTFWRHTKNFMNYDDVDMRKK